jgi:hypothetical protein
VSRCRRWHRTRSPPPPRRVSAGEPFSGSSRSGPEK